jgi:hypothetical protein
MIERFILPERLAGSAQESVRSPRGNSFHKLRDLRHGNSRVDQQVDMVWHYDERDEVVQSADLLSMQNGLGYTLGYSRLFEPGRAQRCEIEFAISCNEGASVGDRSPWEGPVQSKGYKQGCSVGLKMRKVAAVFQVIVVFRPRGISRTEWSGARRGAFTG